MSLTFCVSCQEDIHDSDADFCHSCGAALERAQATETAVGKSLGWSESYVPGLFCAVAFVAVVYYIFTELPDLSKSVVRVTLRQAVIQLVKAVF